MLGKKAKDIVTGFTGILTAKIEYLNGCVQYQIKAVMGKGDKEPKDAWFDQHQIKVLGHGIVIAKKDTGGPVGNMPKSERP